MAWNNEVSFTGNATAEPELHPAKGGGKDRASFRVAINEGRDDNERTMFMSVTAFGPIAKNVAESVSKGDRVTVRGSLSQYDREVFDENGEEITVAVTTIIADAVGIDLTFATAEAKRNPKRGDSEGSSNRGRSASRGRSDKDDGDDGDEDEDGDDKPRRSRSTSSRSTGSRGSARRGRSDKNDDDDGF